MRKIYFLGVFFLQTSCFVFSMGGGESLVIVAVKAAGSAVVSSLASSAAEQALAGAGGLVCAYTSAALSKIGTSLGGLVYMRAQRLVLGAPGQRPGYEELDDCKQELNNKRKGDRRRGIEYIELDDFKEGVRCREVFGESDIVMVDIHARGEIRDLQCRIEKLTNRVEALQQTNDQYKNLLERELREKSEIIKLLLSSKENQSCQSGVASQSFPMVMPSVVSSRIPLLEPLQYNYGPPPSYSPELQK